jgi:ABC-type antimicrobial peptide transport system permease subunit
MLKGQPWRFAMTLAGLTLCILLMLFLISIYKGVEYGSVEYIRKNQADVWILQNNAWNILRGSSLLSTGHGTIVTEVPGVSSVSPVLLLLSGINFGDKKATVFLTGYDPDRPLGGPPCLAEGRFLSEDNEIILDAAFAKKYEVQLGKYIHIDYDSLLVVGFSEGTNALVIQYAFVTLTCARNLIGFPSITTCFAVEFDQDADKSEVIDTIKEELPGIEVFDHQTFLNNNIMEMETGFLPFLYLIALLGIIVLLVILSLLLSISILEKQRDFAILKTLGAGKRFLPGLVTIQAVSLSMAGNLIAIIFFLPLAAIIEHIMPEISFMIQIEQIFWVLSVVLLISLISALISGQRLRHVYPLEVFQ